MSIQISQLLADIRASRRETVAALQDTPDDHMLAENRWAGGPMDVRFLLLRFADHDEEHGLSVASTLQELGFQQSRVQRILGAAEATRGELLGTLVGLSDADMDLAPEGEWPLRETFAHVIRVVDSYRINTLHSAELYQAGQSYEPLPRDQFPMDANPLEEGTLAEYITIFDEVHERALADLAGLSDNA